MGDFLSKAANLGTTTASKIFGVEPNALAAPGPASIVGDILKTVLGLLGVVFTILVIYGALSWMLSRGEEEKIEAAKKLIVNATIGLALAIAGYTLTVLIIDVILKAVVGQGLT